MANTKLRILTAATNLFACKGYAGVSIREVTVAAGVNVSAISYYFGGKETLYKKVLKNQLVPAQEYLELVKSKSKLSAVQKLELYMKKHLAIHKRTPLLNHFLYSEICNPTECGKKIIEEHVNSVNTVFYEIIKEGIDKQEFRNDLNSAYCAISMAGILNFYQLTNHFTKSFAMFPKVNNSDYLEHAFALYLQGILNNKPAS